MIEPGTMSGLAPASPDQLREVLRRFAAGVTVITTRNQDGKPAGMTATAFTSVSLDPPIVLACMNSSSRTAAAVRAAGSFAVNILSSEQGEIAERFAGRSDDKFAGLACDDGPEDLPILAGTAASVACRVRSVTEAGTHLVVLGDVLACRTGDGDVLVYLDGRYDQLQFSDGD